MKICSDLRMMLSERIHANNIRQILNYVRSNNCLREFAEFIFDSDADVRVPCIVGLQSSDGRRDKFIAGNPDCRVDRCRDGL